MNKIVKAVGLIALAAIVVLGVVSCELFASAYTVSGKVVNVRAPANQTEFWKGTTKTTATLAGATITLKDKKTGSTSEFSSTVADDGTFVIAGVAPGKYTLSGKAPDWSFVDREVDITGFFSTVPDVLAFETLADLDDILVMVEWQNTAMDVDAYMTRDSDGDTSYDGTIIAGFAGSLTGGSGVTELRDLGYYFRDPNNRVKLERDILQVGGNTVDAITDAEDALLPRVETIVVTAPVANGPETLRYYIRLFNQTSGSLTGYPGASAQATVFVMQGKTNMGTFPIAVNSSEQILGVLQMQWNASDSSWSIGSYANPGFDSGDWSTLTGVRSIGNGVVEVDAIK